MTSPAASDLPVLDDVLAAAARLEGLAVRTPLLESAAVNRRLGFRLLVKAEPLQRTGSFKFRGAYNRLAQLDGEARRRGVVAFSSGNHAQGVAAAAALLGVPAVIVMPSDAPAIKLANTRDYGAEVVLYDRWTEDREAITAALSATRGLTVVKPFDQPEIIAGQGTVALEVLDQAGTALDAFAAPTGGGGLIAGCGLVLAALSPSTRIYCAEPAGFDDHARSLAAGERLGNPPGGRSICDALLAERPGVLTFALNRNQLAGGVVVDEDEVRHAMAVAFRDYKLVVEPGGAAALAAALVGRIAGDTVAVVASGGNVDPAVFVSALAA